MELLSIKEQLTNKKNTAHAFLIETKGKEDENQILNSVKEIVCPANQKNASNIWYKIDNNQYLETIILDNNQNNIKKEDIILVMNRFATYPIEGQKQVYVIKNIDNISLSVANTLLKFLEEPPTDKIIAIMTANNINRVLPTIKSRCQLVYNKINVNEVDDEEESSIIINCCDILEQYEKSKEKILLDAKKHLELFDNKKAQIIFLKSIIKIYKSIIDYKIKKTKKYNLDYALFDKTTIDSLNKRIVYIISQERYLELNVNFNMFFNKIFIDMKEL